MFLDFLPPEKVLECVHYSSFSAKDELESNTGTRIQEVELTFTILSSLFFSFKSRNNMGVVFPDKRNANYGNK